MAEFLLEILSEEMPARMQRRAVESLHEEIKKFIHNQMVTEFSSEFSVTPRRLIVALSGLPDRQDDLNEERKGPKVGAPDKAVEGFARGAGVAVTDLEERETDKGPCWFAVIHSEGRAIADLLAEAVPSAMAALSWPKSMRWGDHDVRWVRPINAILAVLDGAVVPFSFGPVTSGNRTRGHRFLAPDWFEVSGFEDYQTKLRDAHVMIDQAERRNVIAEGAEALAAEAGLVLDDQPRLLDEVAGLVEWPVPMIGGFDPAFMEIPHEVIVTEMTQHQRYFPLRDADGALAPHFVFAANMEGGDGGAVVRAGNERVLTARLSDGRHFWNMDRKQTLESRVPDLEKVVFHAKLGTVAERVARMERLAEHLARSIPGCDPGLAKRAAHLAKADLTSEMVGEFPELQGVMGSYYAHHDGEVASVAEAIAGHYRPQGPSDICPTAPVSVAVALAEKVDTLVGFFSIDERPTGSRDPFALRRAALGVIRLILENDLRLRLRDVFGASHGYLNDTGVAAAADACDVAEGLIAFFADRLKVHLREEGVRHDLVDVVFARGADDDLVRLMARVRALQAFLATEDGANLLAAYRRAANIVRIEEKKDGVTFDGAVDPARLEQEEERAVAAALVEADKEAEPALEEERFEDAMMVLARMRAPVDAFFDQVTVNADDADLRTNRLNLLAAIRTTLDRVADFSKIEG
jgi:glycyl-tRNA synthetase beta chain